MVQVSFPSGIDQRLLKFAVIAARYQDKWLFCRHKERATWEIPGGHREPDESIEDAARRELWEETGAEPFEIQPVSVYQVTKDKDASYGMLYFAKISRLGALPPTRRWRRSACLTASQRN